VGVGDPEATTVNIAELPGATSIEAGWVVIDGWTPTATQVDKIATGIHDHKGQSLDVIACEMRGKNELQGAQKPLPVGIAAHHVGSGHN